MESITSNSNSLIKHLRRLCQQKKERLRSQQIILDGEHLIDEYSKHSDSPIEHLFLTPKNKKISRNWKYENIYEISSDLMEKVAPTKTPSGYLAIIKTPKTGEKRIYQKVLVLDNIQDPGNVGTIIRTCVAAGCEAVILHNCTELWSPKTLRSSQGIQFSPNIALHEIKAPEAINLFFKKDLWALSLSDKSTNLLHQTFNSDSYGYILGNEGAGISEEFLKIAKKEIFLPMKNDTESLNVAICAGIVLYQHIR